MNYLAEFYGEEIRAYRKSQKLTQENFANLAKVGKESVSRLERGKSISLKTLESMLLVYCNLEKSLAEKRRRRKYLNNRMNYEIHAVQK